MQKELESEGRTVKFLAVNSIDAVANQTDLASKADFPMFQDVDAVRAWEQHGGGKDDFYVYRTDGTLHRYIPYAATSDLSAPENYAAVKQIIVDTP
jgi:hypothetical protein